MAGLVQGIERYLDDDAVDRLRAYYSHFPGRRFDTLGGGGSKADIRDRFVPDDIVAVSLLSVNLAPAPTLALLEPPDSTLTQLLGRVPAEVDLWDADDTVVGAGSPVEVLWTALDRIDRIGWVTAQKLLSRKRPRLIPAFDHAVRAVVRRDPPERWWLELRDALQDRGLRRRLTELRSQAGLDPAVSLLRVLDVAVWMAVRARPERPRPESALARGQAGTFGERCGPHGER
ncbi:MAG: DUF6308 family protein [Acidimicrobiales bacterium]